MEFIAYEDLRVENVVQNHNLAGAIQDAAWSKYLQLSDNDES